MDTVQGFDVSNYYGKLSVSWAQGAREAGMTRATVRASLERSSMVDIARAQIAAFRAAGLEVDGYVWCYPKADNPNLLASRYLAAYGDLGLPRVWLDVEDEDGWSYEDAQSNIDWLQAALQSFQDAGIPIGIYTGRWHWTMPNRYANTHAFAQYPLWDSNFDRNPDLGVWHPYGGWDAPVGKQWCGESSGPEANVAGQLVDRSTWLAEDPPQEDDVTDTVLAQKLADLQAYVDGLLGVVQHCADVLDDAHKRHAWTPVQDVVAELRRNVE